MKLYISAAGIKKLPVSAGGSGGKVEEVASRRIWRRPVSPVVVVLAILLFVRIAFSVLEVQSSSSVDRTGRRFFSGSQSSSLKLRDELTRALLEAKDGKSEEEGSVLLSFNELVNEMASSRQDIKAFAFKAKAMLLRMEHNVKLAKQQESNYWHLASHGVPQSLHCFCLKLAEEYAVNAMARSRLPSPGYIFHLTDPSFHHVVLLTDNVLAASVVVSSTIQHSLNPEKLVFHIITDKNMYPPMHAWFATNPTEPAVVEVKGLHQHNWSEEVNVEVKQMIEIHGEERRSMEAQSLGHNSLSLLHHHLRIYIPKLFPDLNKIVFLDEDIVVQQDLSSLWDMDLNEKVVGAVVGSWCGENCCPGRKYKDYLNFSHLAISSMFDAEHCAWLHGMNVFDLEAWRRSNVTSTYRHWLNLSLNSGFTMWHPGPSLIAFKGQVHHLNPSWHAAGLGHQFPEVPREVVDAAAAIQFNGPAKPWLEVGFKLEARSLWSQHVNSSNKFIRKCMVA